MIMANKHYIPKKDEDFDILQTSVYTTSTNKWSITAQPFNQLGMPHQRSFISP